MFNIKARKKTKLKKSDTAIQSATLIEQKGYEYVYDVGEGEEFTVLAQRDIEQDHAVVTFKNSYGENSYNTWAIYKPDWEFPQAYLKQPQRKVKFRDQKDNWEAHQGPGWRQCCLTSVVMSADHLLNGAMERAAIRAGYKEPEDLYGKVLAQCGVDTTEAYGHPKVLARWGLEYVFVKTIDLTEIAALAKVAPIPIGVAWSTSGHWMTVIDSDKHGLTIHCPYGFWTDPDNIDTSRSGANQHFSWDFLRQIFVDQGPESGWALIPLSVEGEEIGTRQLFD